MDWIEESIKNWEKEAQRPQNSKETLSLIEIMTPYTQILNLRMLQFEIQLMKNKKLKDGLE